MLDDEFDEWDAETSPMAQDWPTIHIFDIKDLETRFYTGNFEGRTRSIEHNQHIYDGYLYKSKYRNSLNVWDTRSITSNSTGSSICEAGSFDVHARDDELEGGGSVAFPGSWHSFAGFKSGFIFVHIIERGRFVLKMTSEECPKPAVCESDSCLTLLRLLPSGAESRQVRNSAMDSWHGRGRM